MKKFLSIFIAVAMVLSLASMFTMAPTSAPVAEAAHNGNIDVNISYDVPSGFDALSPANTFTDPLGFYNGVPNYGVAGALQQTPAANPAYIYIMGFNNGEDYYWEGKLQDSKKYFRYSVVEGTVDEASIPNGAKYWTIDLCPVEGDLSGAPVIDAPETSVHSVIPSNYGFSIATGNVKQDGRYTLRFTFFDDNNDQIGQDYAKQEDDVIIKYDMQLFTSSINPCVDTGNITINGTIGRGNNAGLAVPVDVYVAYPDNTLAAYTTVNTNTHTFSITFPHEFNDTIQNVGDYRIYVRDGRDAYDSANDAEGGNDAIIYDYVSASLPGNPCTFDFYKLDSYLKTLGGNTLIYEGIEHNPVILVLKGHYANCDKTTEATHLVTGMAANLQIVNGVAHAYNTIGAAGFEEISEGVYKAYVEPNAGANVVKFELVVGGNVEAVYTVPVISANAPPESYKYIRPYIDIDTYYSLVRGNGPYMDNTIAREVYDKLPMTVGNSFEMKVGYWGLPHVADPQHPGDFLDDNYHIHKVDVKVSGAVTLDDNDVNYPIAPFINGEMDINDVQADNWYLYRVFKGGVPTLDDVKVQITPTVWHRANLVDCSKWTAENVTETDMAENACCVNVEPKQFVFPVVACPATLSVGDNNVKSVTVGTNTDLTINIAGSGIGQNDNNNNTDDLECGCTYYIVHIYMTDAAGAEVPGAFTVQDKYDSDKSYKLTDLWLNEQDALGTGIDDLPIPFDKTNYNIDFEDHCTEIILRNVTFNYTTQSEDTPKRLVIQLFATKVEKTCSATADFCEGGCASKMVYPLVYEGINDITVLPNLVTAITPESTFAYRAGDDPDTQLLAGDNQTLYFSFSDSGKFTLPNIHWQVFLNNKLISGYRAAYRADNYVPTTSLWDWPYGIVPFANAVEIGDVTIENTTYHNVWAIKFDHALPESGTLEVKAYAYDAGTDSNTEELFDQTVDVLSPEFDVSLILTDGSTITKDDTDAFYTSDGNINITEDLKEKVDIKVTDPRTGKEVDPQTYTFDTVNPEAALMLLAYQGDFNKCDLPLAKVCSSTPAGCTKPSPVTVVGHSNPHIDAAHTFGIYMLRDGTEVRVATFELQPYTIKVDPTEVPFTIPASGTHVTFTVTDAHGHGAPDVAVTLGTSGVSASAAGYGWSAIVGKTGPDGEVDWSFVPPYSGKYYVVLTPDDSCELPCGWEKIDLASGYEEGTFATIVAKYKAPVVDTEAPVITLTAPEDGATVATDMVTVKGTVTDNVGVVSLYIGSMKVDFSPDGTFSADCALSEGENTLKVFAFDAAGNKAEKDITVTYKPVKKTVVTVQIGSDVMTVNGQVAQLDTIPVIHEGHTYLPLRAIAEALGAKVDWIADTKGITLTLGDSSVGLQIGNVSAVVDGNVVAIYPPYLQPYGDGTYAATMVPLRVIAEGLGATVTWDPSTRVVTITLVQP